MGRLTRTNVYLVLMALSIANFTLPSLAQSEDDLVRSPVGKVIAECATANGTLEIDAPNGADKKPIPNVLAATLRGKTLTVRLYIDTRNMTVMQVVSSNTPEDRSPLPVSFTDYRNEIASLCGQTAADFLVPVVSAFERSAFAKLLSGCAEGGKALHLYMGGADNTYMVALGKKLSALVLSVVTDDGWHGVEVAKAFLPQEGTYQLKPLETSLGIAMQVEFHCGAEIAEQVLPQTYNELRALNDILPVFRPFTP